MIFPASCFVKSSLIAKLFATGHVMIGFFWWCKRPNWMNLLFWDFVVTLLPILIQKELGCCWDSMLGVYTVLILVFRFWFVPINESQVVSCSSPPPITSSYELAEWCRLVFSNLRTSSRFEDCAEKTIIVSLWLKLVLGSAWSL